MEGEFSNPEPGVAGEEDSKSKNGTNAHICCVCFRPKTNCFLISCDNCNKWFHGNCVKITEKVAEAIQEWFCLQCQEKDPKLELRHQHKKVCHEQNGETEAKARDGAGTPCREIASDLFSESVGSGPMTLSKDCACPHKKTTLGTLQEVSNLQEKRSARSCGEREACRSTEDGGHCDFCRDTKKCGGAHKIRQKCQRRARESYKHSPSSESPEPAMRTPPAPEDHFQTLKEAREAVAPLSLAELPLDPEIYPDFPAGAFEDHSLPSLSDPEDAPFPEPVLRDRVVTVKHIKRRSETSKKKCQRQRQKQRRNKKRKHTEPPDPEDQGPLPQCLGPNCVRPAQPGSKYCSDACGLALAASRIYEILPRRIQEWQRSPCVAEEWEKKLLKEIRKEQREAWLHVRDAERRFQELEDVILQAKRQVVQENGENNNKRYSKHSEHQIFCVSCGHSVNSQVALRHMERCYAKYESQMIFGSLEPTRIEGVSRLFCQVYSPQSKTYCKRLKVLCPEHSREPKAPADEVCGCPLVRNVFELTGDFCRLPKRQCNQHYCWEKLHRAEVDLEQLRAWGKLQMLWKQERNIQMAKANRAGLLALMLHRTIQHDPLTSDLRTKPDH
ncbi:CXXC-type zinc finger protein 1-like [Sarcophilus harrisii]|uniref:CXXC-type zinc finger protein 1 n=1 Tax=Sarcophilus harrisii TaxID=9305 RepID=A0A7N4NXT2_SARHA